MGIEEGMSFSLEYRVDLEPFKTAHSRHISESSDIKYLPNSLPGELQKRCDVPDVGSGGTFLVVQWFKICLTMQGTHV